MSDLIVAWAGITTGVFWIVAGLWSETRPR